MPAIMPKSEDKINEKSIHDDASAENPELAALVLGDGNHARTGDARADSTEDNHKHSIIIRSPHHQESDTARSASENGKTLNSKDKNKSKSKSKSDGLSTVKIIASAGAAVTASIVTSMMAGYLNSIMIVAITSVIIAVASEVYSRTLKKTVKASARALTVMPLPAPVNDHLEEIAADTIQFDPVTGEVTAITTPVMPGDENTNVNNDDATGGADDNDDTVSRRHGKITTMLSRISPVTKIILMLTTVAILSIGASWMVTTVLSHPNVTNVTENNITRREVVTLTDEDKKELQDEATATIRGQLSTLEDTINQQNDKITDLESHITALEASTGTTDDTDGNDDTGDNDANNGDATLSTETNELKKQVTDLKRQVSTLQDTVNSLKSSQDANSSSSSKNE